MATIGRQQVGVTVHYFAHVTLCPDAYVRFASVLPGFPDSQPFPVRLPSPRSICLSHAPKFCEFATPSFVNLVIPGRHSSN